MFTDNCLQTIRTTLMENIAYARYTIGDMEYMAQVESKEILGDGRISVLISLALDGSSTAVTNVRFYDPSGGLLAEKSENIACDVDASAVYYRFYITITEVKEL